MRFLEYFFPQGGAAGALMALAAVIVSGLLLGGIRIRGAGLGVAGVLFSGILCANLGVSVAPAILDFVRDFGLVFFVYAVGIQVGPGFLDSLKERGAKLGVICACFVALGAAVALLIGRLAGLPVAVTAGLLAGATTNTPAMAAAQDALCQMGFPGEASLSVISYSVAYPFGIVGVIFALVALDLVYRSGARQDEPSLPPQDAPGAELARVVDPAHVIAVFAGIIAGTAVGSIPVHLPGSASPIRLGLAAGTLVTAVLLGRLGKLGPLDWNMPRSAADIMREVGIALFLACVGLKSGIQFTEALARGDGLRWMALAAPITFAPVFLGGIVLKSGLGFSLPEIRGLLSAGSTNPAALAYANLSGGAKTAALAFAAVYPLAMVLRIVSAQLVVLLFR